MIFMHWYILVDAIHMEGNIYLINAVITINRCKMTQVGDKENNIEMIKCYLK